MTGRSSALQTGEAMHVERPETRNKAGRDHSPRGCTKLGKLVRKHPIKLRKLWPILLGVVVGAAAILLAQWLTGFLTPPASVSLEVLDALLPSDEQLAALALVVGSPCVEIDEQGRLFVEGLEPYEYGILKASDLPPFDMSLRMSNVGDVPATLTDFEVLVHTSPNCLRATGHITSSESPNVFMDVGEVKDLRIHFTFVSTSEMCDPPVTGISTTSDSSSFSGYLSLIVRDTWQASHKTAILLDYSMFEEADVYLVGWIVDTRGAYDPVGHFSVQPSIYFNPRANSSFANSYSLLGAGFAACDRDEEAMVALRIAIALDYKDPFLYSLRGNIWIKRSDTESAIEDYRRAIALNPEIVGFHINLGALYISSKDYEAAEACFERCLELDPTNYCAHFNLASVFLATARYAEAVEALSNALMTEPFSREAYHSRSRAYSLLGDEDKAAADAEAAERFNWKPQCVPFMELSIPQNDN